MTLKGKRIAILATDGFETSELFKPKEAVEREGGIVHIISLEKGEIKGMTDHEWDKTISVDVKVSAADSSDYDALILPGGVISPDALRSDKDALDFVKDFIETKKPVASICHGPQILISAQVVAGKKLTSYQAIAVDLKNAGAEWVDQEVVIDQGLITSRTPDDLPAFNKTIVKEFSK